MRVCFRFLFTLTLLTCVSTAGAQQVDREKIIEALEKDGCVSLEAGKVKVCKYDYSSGGKAVEALSFRPASEGRFPGVLLIPGFQRTAPDLIPMGSALAREGYAAVAVSQPGFGRSEGKADYVGPATLHALTEGFEKLKREPYVDAKRMGIYGYSRGGMAASLLAVRLGTDVKAAVFGAGIYDFKKAHDEVKIEGIRKNMEAETGMTEGAIAERSSILEMKNLKCPVLILHGEKDENVSVNQALLLRDELTRLKKDFEIRLYPDTPHGIDREEVIKRTLDFFNRRLKGATGAEVRFAPHTRYDLLTLR